MKFEWDAAKAERNTKKHGIRFEDAVRVFDSTKPLFEDYDEEHSANEIRWFVVGPVDQIIMHVSYTEKENSLVTRIISARQATNAEAKAYRQWRLQWQK